MLDELVPAAAHVTEQYGNNNRIEADHGRLKARLRPPDHPRRVDLSLRCRAQYTSVRFTEHLDLEGIRPSIGSVGDAYDNALMNA